MVSNFYGEFTLLSLISQRELTKKESSYSRDSVDNRLRIFDYEKHKIGQNPKQRHYIQGIHYKIVPVLVLETNRYTFFFT